MRRTLAALAVLISTVTFLAAPNAAAASPTRHRVLHGGPSNRFQVTVVVIRSPHHAWRFSLTMHCAHPAGDENAFMPGAGIVSLQRTDETGGKDGFDFGSVEHQVQWRNHVAPGRWWLKIYTGCRWTLRVAGKGVKPLRHAHETVV